MRPLALVIGMLVGCPQADPSIDAGTPDGSSSCSDCKGYEQCEEGRCVALTCRDSLPCPSGAVCVETQCQPICQTSDCPSGERCLQNRCTAQECLDNTDCDDERICKQGRCFDVDEVPCELDSDCPDSWRCSHYGRCFQGDCLVHEDCPADDRCVATRCIERPTSPEGVQFEKLEVLPLTLHTGADGQNLSQGYGFGGGLLDFDGDGDLDIFLGASSLRADDFSPPCLYRNDSTPGTLRFVIVEEACEWEEITWNSGWAADLNNDGKHELVQLGDRGLRIKRFGPNAVDTNLMAALDSQDYRSFCKAGAMEWMDLDRDGLVDMVIGCQLGASEVGGRPLSPRAIRANLPFKQMPDGRFELFDSVFDDILSDDGSTLGLSSLDVNEDGLLDLIVANDTFSTLANPGHSEMNPGSVYFSCSPLEDCLFDRRLLDTGADAWGSFMGIGNLHVEGLGEHLYFSDWGPNRAVQYVDGIPVNRAFDLGLDLSSAEQQLLYAWGVAVEDFNRDGYDDLLVGQGSVGPEPFPLHDDVLFLQDEGGNFRALTEEVGIEEHGLTAASPLGGMQSTRGLTRVDLDLDGYLEILMMPQEGRPVLYREVPQKGASPRCTLRPRSRYVAAVGSGFALQEAGSSRFARRDIQGQLRLGLSPWLISNTSSGKLRYPSGAIQTYDCEGTAGPIDLEEPEWIEISRSNQRLTLRFDHPWWPEANWDLAVRGAAGVRQENCVITDQHCQVQLHDGDEEFMLRREGRWWIHRWFALP